MQITATQRFRDGRDTYEQGETYDVPEADGAYFVRSGWATSPDYAPPGAPAPEPVELQPDSTSHGQEAGDV